MGYKYFIGIDPGLTGGVAIICEGICKVIPIPRFEQKEIDVVALWDFFTSTAPLNLCYCVIEQVHAVGYGFRGRTQGNTSAFTFGMGYGQMLATLRLAGIDYDKVAPQLWKSRFNLNDDKKNSILLANQLFGKNLKSKQDGMAEALLLAKYAQSEGQYLKKKEHVITNTSCVSSTSK